MMMGFEYPRAGLILLEPVAEEEIETFPLAPRVPELSGKRIGFLDNSKERADEILAVTEELLTGRFEFAAVLRRRKRYYTKNAPPELIEELAERCDLAVTAVGG
ncbi:MAG: hypothetical protein ACE5I9_07955 [Candidatus Methylomirabilales bacterium]